MERRATVSLLRAIFLALMLAAIEPLAAGERQVVLVVAVDSPIAQLNPIEIRKLFLGMPVLHNNRPLHPLRNTSDTRLTEVFLQHVVAMSESAYNRRILAQMMQQGHPRPPEFKSTADIVANLRADRNAVSYLWLRDVAGNPHLRILRVLWSE